MAEQGQYRDADFVLRPNTYAFVLDTTKGKVDVAVGPYKTTISQSEKLVRWHDGQWLDTHSIEDATLPFSRANEGQYTILTDPAEDDIHPIQGKSNDAVALNAGRRVIMPGPVTFALWPGQEAHTIDGHHLKSNQYLVVRVYEPEQAKANAQNIIASGGGEGEKKDDATNVLGDHEFTMGQLYVIKGTDVSFFIPSTGFEVIPDERRDYVREAATLERLQYCVLLDEDGEKRFVQGPAVVFPSPTEHFQTDSEGNRVFRALELNEQSGIYIKVIADYEEGDGKGKVSHKEGDELFITGKETPIYFPRSEHTIIEYGGADDQVHRKHHAIAIPKGEGRYVLDRRSGEVELVRGPKMFLPDPRYQVVVRRVLDPKSVEVMYPGNQEALYVNQAFAQQMAEHSHSLAPTAAGGVMSNYLASASIGPLDRTDEAMTQGALRGRSASTEFGGETTRRGQRYTPPRTITLDTKYDGAVAINIFPGYAVLVVDKAGNRRVEQGPRAVLLEYDETLMRLSLSTGRPKSDANLYKTVYLRTVNNQVTDTVSVETNDLVRVQLSLSYRVNFKGSENLKWFDIENYVQLLTDHCRSKLRNVAKRNGIKEFYTNTIDIIRDILLGKLEEGADRPGILFDENQMHLYDVEVLGVTIEDANVQHILGGAMRTALEGTVAVTVAEENAKRTAEIERFRRQEIDSTEETRERHAQAQVAELQRNLTATLEEIGGRLESTHKEAEIADIGRAEKRAEYENNLELQGKLQQQELEAARAEVEMFVQRMHAFSPQFIAALNAFGDEAFVSSLVDSLGPLALSTGVTTADVLGQVFKGTPFQGILDNLADRPYALTENGHSDPKPVAAE